MRKIGFACLLAIALIAAPAADAAGERYGSRTLKQGMHGRDVKLLQKYLTRAGHRATADGAFGRGTKRALRAWERAGGHPANGVATRPDQRALKADAAGGQTGGESPGSTEQQPASAPGEKATVGPDGLAVAPASAPPEVKEVIAAGNEIAKKPYKYGGGHGSWEDSGYDCSGSISYALHGGGFLDRALDSGDFMSWAESGKGQWITVYAQSGHAYMVVAGLRFDTSGLSDRGTRWTDEMRSSSGYTARHPEGF